MTDSWPVQKIARLKTLWAEGYSASMVGERLGCSRNAVIGKVHRLKLPKPSMKLAPLRQRVKAETPQPPPQEHPKLLPLPRRGGKPPRLPAAPVVILPPRSEPAVMPDIPGSRVVTLEMRGHHQCRWPVNDGGPFLYCGAPRVSGQSYCAHHMRIRLRPPKGRPRATG